MVPILELQMSFFPAGGANSAPLNPLAAFEELLRSGGGGERKIKGKKGSKG